MRWWRLHVGVSIFIFKAKYTFFLWNFSNVLILYKHKHMLVYYVCNRGTPIVHLLFTLTFFCNIGFVHVFILWIFPEPWTLLSSFIRSPVWMCIPPHPHTNKHTQQPLKNTPFFVFRWWLHQPPSINEDFKPSLKISSIKCQGVLN